MNKKLLPFDTHVANYAIYGLFLGAFFPISAYFLMDKPAILFAMICMAPIATAVFAGFAGGHYDIVNKKVKEQTKLISEQKNLFEMALNEMEEGIIIANDKSEFLLWNKTGEEVVGIGATDSDESDWSDVYGCYYQDKRTLFPVEELPLVKAINGERSESVPMFIRNQHMKDGRFIEVSGRPLVANGKVLGGLVFFKDVSGKAADPMNRKKKVS